MIWLWLSSIFAIKIMFIRHRNLKDQTKTIFFTEKSKHNMIKVIKKFMITTMNNDIITTSWYFDLKKIYFQPMSCPCSWPIWVHLFIHELDITAIFSYLSRKNVLLLALRLVWYFNTDINKINLLNTFKYILILNIYSVSLNNISG